MFSSIYPRITEEKFMAHMFQVAIDTLGDPAGGDLEAYLGKMGTIKDGQDELLMIPKSVLKFLMALYRINRWLKPKQPYDLPFLPFEMRVGVKFFIEYDVAFSRATLDGRLSEGFDPEDALKKVSCPMLLLQAAWSRHKTWGLLGAMDAADVQKIKSLVKDLRYVHIDSSHGIHIGEPHWYLQQVDAFINKIDAEGDKSGQPR
jgi:pimeloyl-ACP methyl ester carboxylesterase